MRVLSIILAVLLLAGCASTEVKEESTVKDVNAVTQVAVEEKPTETKDVEDVPSWFLNPPEKTGVLYASGYGKMSDKQNSMKKAQMNAKTEMAEYLNTAIVSLTEIYHSEEVWKKDMKDEGKDYSAFKDAFSSSSVQSASAFLVGATREDVYFDNDGGCYVLMSIQMDNIQSQISSLALGYGMSPDIIKIMEKKLESQIVNGNK